MFKAPRPGFYQVESSTQRFQDPLVKDYTLQAKKFLIKDYTLEAKKFLIKDYTLNHNIKASII